MEAQPVMWTLKKTITISAAHRLPALKGSPCQRLHGHNWTITVWCRSATLNEQGMVVDFSEVKRMVMALDHADITEIIEGYTTAERIARWIAERVPLCFKVEVEETPGSTIAYEVG